MTRLPRVAFYVYPTAFQNPGGGEVQLLKTKEYLERLGVPVKLFDPWHDRLLDFDLLHTFGSVKDALPMMEEARRAGIKNVLSTICWYSWKSAWGTYPDLRTRAVQMVRHAAKVWAPFLPSERRRMMEISDLLLPNSLSEAEQLTRFFCVPRNKVRVIPNAVDPVFEGVKPDLFRNQYGLEHFILVVGRIEPRKNQLGVIRALKGVDADVVVIGDSVSRYRDYEAQCRKEAGEKVHFLGYLPHDSELLRSAYAACDTFLLATWLETPGLAALEAGLAGAKVVVTREGATEEYFGPHAAYVSPDRPREIRDTVMSVFRKAPGPGLREHIRQNYLWPAAAGKLLTAYQSLMGPA
ncbi:MAG: glycosyltransferase [Candidatus Omnitrophota bacterium]|jgi:glycosyltransferase involved in cell wall biosynthesis